MARIDIAEVKHMCDQFQREANRMKNALDGLKKDVTQLIEDNDLQGQMADSAKSYYQDIILVLVKKGKNVLDEGMKKVKKYIADFHDQVDPSGNARLDSEVLYEMEIQIANYQYMMENILVEMKMVGGIDALPQQFKQLDKCTSAMSTINKKIDILRKFETFEASHQDTLNEVLTDLYYVKQGLEDVQSGRFFKGKSHSYEVNSKVTWLSHLKEKDNKMKTDYDWDSFEKHKDNNGFWMLSKKGLSYKERLEISSIYNGLIINGKLKSPDEMEQEESEEMTKIMADTIWAAWADQLQDGSGNNLDNVQKMSITIGSSIGLASLLWVGKTGSKGVKINSAELTKLKNMQKTMEGSTYSVNKPTSVLQSQLVRDYIRDIETRTGRGIPKNQVDLLKEALRVKEYTALSKAETATHRKEFNRVKNDIIEEWELNTGQKWPTYDEPVYSANGNLIKKVGYKYDAHHIIENGFGGDNKWWNIHPAKAFDEHQGGIHGSNAPSKDIFKRE
ncbi:T7SS effector LXG polymorphic toxin [Listeria sp. ILCC797]|uniref:T7SS effector LXG polymorphic toxin n=2 Tax=unclassified Listeria TaxID=2642072 RepID=UPI0013566051|nr:T7SS effector LXG polymorphic toxin [Listeria sp. ILCC797]